MLSKLLRIHAVDAAERRRRVALSEHPLVTTWLASGPTCLWVDDVSQRAASVFISGKLLTRLGGAVSHTGRCAAGNSPPLKDLVQSLIGGVCCAHAVSSERSYSLLEPNNLSFIQLANASRKVCSKSRHILFGFSKLLGRHLHLNSLLLNIRNDRSFGHDLTRSILHLFGVDDCIDSNIAGAGLWLRGSFAPFSEEQLQLILGQTSRFRDVLDLLAPNDKGFDVRVGIGVCLSVHRDVEAFFLSNHLRLFGSVTNFRLGFFGVRLGCCSGCGLWLSSGFWRTYIGCLYLSCGGVDTHCDTGTLSFTHLFNARVRRSCLRFDLSGGRRVRLTDARSLIWVYPVETIRGGVDLADLLHDLFFCVNVTSRTSFLQCLITVSQLLLRGLRHTDWASALWRHFSWRWAGTTASDCAGNGTRRATKCSTKTRAECGFASYVGSHPAKVELVLQAKLDVDVLLADRIDAAKASA